MSLNLFDLMSKYSQFQQMLKTMNKNPKQLLEDELKRRNISPEQLNQMMQQAQQLQQLFGRK